MMCIVDKLRTPAHRLWDRCLAVMITAFAGVAGCPVPGGTRRPGVAGADNQAMRDNSQHDPHRGACMSGRRIYEGQGHACVPRGMSARYSSAGRFRKMTGRSLLPVVREISVD
jgi:hypothetical protein